jgi:electron transport complex protein RnfA
MLNVLLELKLMIVSAVFINNVVLTQFLGICPFLGVSRKMSSAIGMGSAVIFVMTIGTICTHLCYTYILSPLGLKFLEIISFILIIAMLAQMVEMIIKKVSIHLYHILGVFLPLLSTNCVILGVAIIVIQKEYHLVTSVIYTVSTGLGFALALVIFASIREQLELVNIPKSMRGASIALVIAGIMAMAFMGLSGIV